MPANGGGGDLQVALLVAQDDVVVEELAQGREFALGVDNEMLHPPMSAL